MKRTIVSLFVILMVSLMASENSLADDPILCPRCHFSNEARYRFCTKCGAPLPRPAQTTGTTVVHSPMMEPKAIKDSPPAVLEVGMSRVFHLKDKNVVSGKIVEMAGDSMAVIETVDGRLNIPASEIYAEIIEILKTDETHYYGPLLSEDEFSVSLKTPYGVVVVLKKDVQKMDRYYGDTKVSWQEERQRFFGGEELTTIFLDPTANPLPPYSFYVSGLSLGYGFTENFSLYSKFGDNFAGDLNLEPHLRVFHRSTGATELSVSLGLRLYSFHPMADETERYSHWIINKRTGDRRDEEDPVLDVDRLLTDPEEKIFHWGSYLVMSRRASLSNGRGKWGLHIGAETNGLMLNRPELDPNGDYVWDDQFSFPYRVWGAWDYDLSKRIKFMMEIFADNGHKSLTLSQARRTYFDSTPFTIDAGEGNYKPVDFDFGFLWTMTESFRVGMHWQSPYLAFYWRW